MGHGGPGHLLHGGVVGQHLDEVSSACVPLHEKSLAVELQEPSMADQRIVGDIRKKRKMSSSYNFT